MGKTLEFRRTETVDGIDQSDALTLASDSCTNCHGRGVVLLQVKPFKVVCRCVYRSAFRAVMRRYHDPTRRIYLRRSGKGWCFPDGEFRRDVELLARLALAERDRPVFELYHVGRLEAEIVARRLDMSRGNVYHAVYRLEAEMGRTLMLGGFFPLQKYFAGQDAIGRVPPAVAAAPKLAEVVPIRRPAAAKLAEAA